MKYDVKITINLLVSGDTATSGSIVQEWTRDIKAAVEDILLENEKMTDFEVSIKEVKEDDTRTGEEDKKGT